MSRLYAVLVWSLALTGAPASGQTVDASALSDRPVHAGTFGGGLRPGHLFAPHGTTVDEIRLVPGALSFALPTVPASADKSAGNGPVFLPFGQYGAPLRLTGGLSALLPIKTLREGAGALAIELQGSVGLGGWRVAAGPSYSGLPWLWGDILVTATRTRDHPRGAFPESTYVGAEAGLAFLTPLSEYLSLPVGFLLKPSVGFAYRLDGPGSLKPTMFTWSVGGYLLTESLVF